MAIDHCALTRSLLFNKQSGKTDKMLSKAVDFFGDIQELPKFFEDSIVA